MFKAFKRKRMHVYQNAPETSTIHILLHLCDAFFPGTCGFHSSAEKSNKLKQAVHVTNKQLNFMIVHTYRELANKIQTEWTH